MISERLQKVILSALSLDEFEFQDGTLAGDVPGWDSLSHVKVIIAVEKAFGVRFNTKELLGLRNVGDLQTLVDSKAH